MKTIEDVLVDMGIDFSELNNLQDTFDDKLNWDATIYEDFIESYGRLSTFENDLCWLFDMYQDSYDDIQDFVDMLNEEANDDGRGHTVESVLQNYYYTDNGHVFSR